MRADLNLFITDDESHAETDVWVTPGGDACCTITLGGVTYRSTPRRIRAFAEQLVAAADEACRREDELTDPDYRAIGLAGVADARAALEAAAS